MCARKSCPWLGLGVLLVCPALLVGSWIAGAPLSLRALADSGTSQTRAALPTSVGAQELAPANVASASLPEKPAYPDTFVCPANGITYTLTLPADPIQIVLTSQSIFLVADGALYTFSLDRLAYGPRPVLRNVLPSGHTIGGFPVQELVYATVDTETDDLILLDKSLNIYRYTASGQWMLETGAKPIAGQYGDPQFLALQSTGGRVYALDTALGHIWAFGQQAENPVSYLYHTSLVAGIDMVIPPDGVGGTSVIVLTRLGEVVKFVQGHLDRTFTPFTAGGPLSWPAQVTLANGGQILVVSGDERSVTAIDSADGSPIWRATFRFPGMPRLRSAAVMGSVLYGLAGRNLYVANLDSGGTTCPPVTYDDGYYFHGVDVKAAMPAFHLPRPHAALPERLYAYPGARRLYRSGIHEGLDLYALDVEGLAIGTPVSVVADGVVVRADRGYAEMTPGQYETALGRTQIEHWTPPDVLDQFLGRQIRIAHSEGIESRYAHLHTVLLTIRSSEVVSQGTVIGRVGVSGTSEGVYGAQDNVHLHFELWINGRYLGYGLSLYETMRLWQAVFD